MSGGEETDPRPEGGTSRNTDRSDLAEHTYVVSCIGSWCKETYVWTGPAPLHGWLDVIWPQVVQALKAAGWRVIGDPVARLNDPQVRLEAECPEHNPYGREFKEAVRQVLAEDQHETNQRAIMSELERPLLLGETWYADTHEPAEANMPTPHRAPSGRTWYGSPDPEPDEDHTSDGRCKYPATCILENRHPVDPAQEPPANVPSGLVLGGSIRFPAPGGGWTVLDSNGRRHEPDDPDPKMSREKVHVTPSQQTIEAIAKAFDVPVELLGTPGAYENAVDEQARRQAWAEDLARKATTKLTDWCPACGTFHKPDAACRTTGTMNARGRLGSDHSGITPHYVAGDTNLDDGACDRAPRGWWCSRRPNHDGPCAARPRWWNVRRWFTRKDAAE